MTCFVRKPKNQILYHYYPKPLTLESCDKAIEQWVKAQISLDENKKELKTEAKATNKGGKTHVSLTECSTIEDEWSGLNIRIKTPKPLCYWSAQWYF